MAKEPIRLEVYHNGAHARIMFPNGSRSRIVVTRHQALALLSEPATPKISDFEHEVITHDILVSPLIPKSKEYEKLCENPSITPDQIKAHFDRLFGPREMPAAVGEEVASE
jgi:hypothetical protein